MTAQVPTPPVLDAVFLPSLVQPEFFANKTVVVVDVLRATTTITTLVDLDCQYVLPQGSIDQARESHRQLESDAATAGQSMLGGERNGKVIPGFHHGNSPIEYGQTDVRDKIVILATTNGTVAMDRCRLARRVIVGAMVNLTAVARQLIDDPDVVVLCSGTDRLITQEDVIYAGALIQRIGELRQESGLRVGQLTDPARVARGHWRSIVTATASSTEKRCPAQLLTDVFKNSRGGINLARIGHLPDIEFAARVDAVPVVPELNLKTWQIRRLATSDR